MASTTDIYHLPSVFRGQIHDYPVVYCRVSLYGEAERGIFFRLQLAQPGAVDNREGISRVWVNRRVGKAVIREVKHDVYGKRQTANGKNRTFGV